MWTKRLEYIPVTQFHKHIEQHELTIIFKQMNQLELFMVSHLSDNILLDYVQTKILIQAGCEETAIEVRKGTVNLCLMIAG